MASRLTHTAQRHHLFASPVESLRPGGTRLFRRRLHGLDYLRICAAAAEIAREIVPNLIVVGIGMPLKQLLCHQHEAWRAEAALKCSSLDERFLYRIEHPSRIQMFDGDDIGAVNESRQIETT